MQKWEEIEQKKEYLEGYINSKNREALIKDQIQQLRLDTMFPALQGDGIPRGRPDRDGSHRGAFERNKKKIYATQTVCGICGKPVDFGLKYPHPLSPCIDHIIPIAKGGHPSDINNLQLAHWTCNRQKSDKLIKRRDKEKDEVISNRVLPHTFDWKNIRRSK